MRYRDIVVDGQVCRRSYARRPEGYRLGDPVPGWERWTPVEETDRGIVVTVVEDLEAWEREMVETWARLDEIAAERGIEQTGPAWDLVRQTQRRYLRTAPEVRIDADDYDRVTASLSREEARLIRAYAVALDDPEEALRMVGPEYDAGAALARLLGESIGRTADQRYGGEA